MTLFTGKGGIVMIRSPLVITVVALFSGCATHKLTLRHDVVLSFDEERIAYTATGKGNTSLIFIHGWSCDGRYWQNQISAFAEEYQVIIVDLAGHGHSSSTRQEYSMLSYANDVKAVIEKEKVETAIFIGHSMGGGVIAEAARLMPETVIGIVGVDTFQNVADRPTRSFIEEMTRPFEDNFVLATQNFVSSMFPEDTDQQIMNWIKEDMSSAPQDIAVNAFANYLGQYVTGEAAVIFDEIAVPVVSINARLWPTSPEDNRNHIKNYHLFYIENSGHFPMLENAKEFNRLLKKAINTIERESRQHI
jgi:pimeloyl-ACP methyl ester carboxylesterase